MDYFFELKPEKETTHECMITDFTRILTNISKDCGYDEVDSVRVISVSDSTHIMSTKCPVEVIIDKEADVDYPIHVKMFITPKAIENRGSFQNQVSKVLCDEFLDEACTCTDILIGFSFQDYENELTKDIINDVIDTYRGVINGIPDISLTSFKVKSDNHKVHIFAFLKLNKPQWINTEVFKSNVYLLVENNLDHFSFRQNKDMHVTAKDMYKWYLKDGKFSVSEDIEYIESISQLLEDIEDYTNWE